MEINAFKMDGLGNDFVIIDQRIKKINLTKAQIIKICDRNFIGCDQLIYINNSSIADASIEFYNSDGSTSGACGNGTRCVAYLISKEKKLKNISLNIDNHILNSKILENFEVETTIGKPKTNWKDIPISREANTENLNLKIKDINKNELTGGIGVNVGNPHVVFFGKSIKDTDLESIGPRIENHELFPKKTNVEIVEVINSNLIEMRVWERGVGITLACGSGACAAVYAAWKKGLIENNAEVKLEKGSLHINIVNNESIMTGPAEISYRGSLEI